MAGNFTWNAFFHEPSDPSFVSRENRLSTHSMPTATQTTSSSRGWSLNFILLCLLLGTLWIAGGASRGDVAGQVVARLVAWCLLIFAFLFGERPDLATGRPVLFVLLAAIVLVLLQLVPLPPAVWQALPGRTIFSEAAAASGQPQPWRPSAIVPSAAVNAAASLVVPFAAWLFAGRLNHAEQQRLTALVLILCTGSALLGLIQISGTGLSNPFINDTASQMSGTFANRNHFALFLAFGLLVAPVWAFQKDHRFAWRGPVALGLVLFFTLAILGTGSRAGLGLGAIAIVLALTLVRQRIRRELDRYPRWIFLALIAGIVASIIIAVFIGITADRAVSINRLFDNDVGQDMRRRSLPVVWSMIVTYFPMGTGAGSFDPIFRLHEPFRLLKPTYFNHAHNDFLEVILDTGIFGLGLMLAALLWWVRAGWHTWRRGNGSEVILPKLGWAMLLLVIIASMFDYPARTPMMMAMIAVAGVWLSTSADSRRTSAIKKTGQQTEG